MTVKPQRDLRRFELFLASYFNGFPAVAGLRAATGRGNELLPIHGSRKGWRRLANFSARRCGSSDLR